MPDEAPVTTASPDGSSIANPLARSRGPGAPARSSQASCDRAQRARAECRVGRLPARRPGGCLPLVHLHGVLGGPSVRVMDVEDVARVADVASRGSERRRGSLRCRSRPRRTARPEAAVPRLEALRNRAHPPLFRRGEAESPSGPPAMMFVARASGPCWAGRRAWPHGPERIPDKDADRVAGVARFHEYRHRTLCVGEGFEVRTTIVMLVLAAPPAGDRPTQHLAFVRHGQRRGTRDRHGRSPLQLLPPRRSRPAHGRPRRPSPRRKCATGRPATRHRTSTP